MKFRRAPALANVARLNGSNVQGVALTSKPVCLPRCLRCTLLDSFSFGIYSEKIKKKKQEKVEGN